MFGNKAHEYPHFRERKMKDNQHEQLFTELDDEVAATCSGGVAYTGGPDPDVILYTHGGTNGVPLKVNASINDGLIDLGENSFNDRVSSFIILRGRWNFYADAGFRGRYNSRPLRAGTYSSLPRGFSNDQLSSLKRVG
jgi:hypothetical protein